MRWIKVLLHPEREFENVKKEKISETIFNFSFGLFLMVALMASTIVLLGLFKIKVFWYYITFLTFSIMIAGVSLILSFVVFIITGKYSLEKSFKVIVYSYFPFALSGFLLLIGGVISSVVLSLILVWMLFLEIVGISKLFDVDRTTSSVCAILFQQVIILVMLPVFTLL